MDVLIQQWSYFGIIVFLVLTGCGLPIPEEVAIILAGVLSAKGQLMVEPAFASCLVGALLGDCVMYAIGYHWGHSLLVKHPRCAKFLRADREERFETAIQRHGFKVLLLARFMVGVRGPVYLAAGIVRMPFRKFLLFDAICVLLVVSTVFGLSYVAGETIADSLHEVEVVLTIGVLVVMAIVGVYFWKRKR